MTYAEYKAKYPDSARRMLQEGPEAIQIVESETFIVEDITETKSLKPGHIVLIASASVVGVVGIIALAFFCKNLKKK